MLRLYMDVYVNAAITAGLRRRGIDVLIAQDVSGMRNRVETVDLKIRMANRPVRVPPDGYGAPLATPLEAGLTRRVSPSCDNSCLQ